MSFTKNAEAEILANLGILSNQNSSRKEVYGGSVNDIKEVSNRTRLLSSSDNDKLSSNFDSDDDTMIVFNNSNTSKDSYLNKIIKMSNWQSYLIALPILLFMNYLIGIFHLLPHIYKEEFNEFWSGSIFGIAIGCIILTGFIQYVAVIMFITNVFYFTKGSLLILISSSTDSKTFFLIYFFIALGGLIAPITLSKSLIHVTNVEIKTQNLLTKRDISTFLDTKSVVINNTINPNGLKKNISFTNNISTTTTYINLNTTTKISKPDSVIGVVENQDKKTEENVLQRAEAEEKRKKNESDLQLNVTTSQIPIKNKITEVKLNQEDKKLTTNNIIKNDVTTSKEMVREENTWTTTIKTTTYKSTKTSKKISLEKVIKKDNTSLASTEKIVPGPYVLEENVVLDKFNLLIISLGIIIIITVPSLFFEILNILNMKKLPNDTLFKYIESITYSSLPIKGIILSYIIWSILSTIECTFAYCQLNKIINGSQNLLFQATPTFALLLVRFIGIFYCRKFITIKILHAVQIITIVYVSATLYLLSNIKWNVVEGSDNQMITQYSIGILGLLIGCIGPMYFSWISKMVQKNTINLLNYFILTHLGSVFVANVLYNYLLKDTDEGKIENTLYILLMLLITLEICFVFLSLHLSSYYRQTEIARLTNSLSGNSRKQTNDVSVKIKKNKYGYNRLINDSDVHFESLIESDSDSNEEIFG
uniref:Major facilitator superfamily associated domain-containing protein n=1 Tax=Strongyloides stercoralis TaxID=6248 RepID=A0A0K0EM74_STRER